MGWIEKWIEKRRIKALKRKLSRMKKEARAAEEEPLMPAMETISRKIRLERIDVLEKAVEKIESRQGDASKEASDNIGMQAG
ncbi:MAG: hypothetical protein ACO1N5_13135 [Noviherbaspirillum sp.]